MAMEPTVFVVVFFLSCFFLPNEPHVEATHLLHTPGERVTNEEIDIEKGRVGVLRKVEKRATHRHSFSAFIQHNEHFPFEILSAVSW